MSWSFSKKKKGKSSESTSPRSSIDSSRRSLGAVDGTGLHEEMPSDEQVDELFEQMLVSFVLNIVILFL